MYKNQLQELAQRSCFNLPSYACTKEGPNHAPRFRASVNFNGEIFESRTFCTTLRQAEHSAAELALNVLSSRGPSKSLTARVLDETGIYKNLLQETAHRAGLRLPVYTTVRSGPGHVPTFTCTVEIAGSSFSGDPGKTKKQAEKNAAISAWSSLNRMPIVDLLGTSSREEQAKKLIRDGHCQIISFNVLSNNSRQKQKMISVASLVPPMPAHHRTASKILSSPSPSQHRARDDIVLRDHLKDEDEWLGGGAKKEGRPDHQSSSCGYEPRHHHHRRYVHPQRIAPAVHMRSVIPVCSAPPTTTLSSFQPKAASVSREPIVVINPRFISTVLGSDDHQEDQRDMRNIKTT